MSQLIDCGGSASTDKPEIVEGFDALRNWVSTGQMALINKTLDFTKNTPVGFQATLVSNVNIKTVNAVSLVGSGDVAVQPTLVSATNIKSINGATVLGSGNMVVGNSHSFTASGAIAANRPVQLLATGAVSEIKGNLFDLITSGIATSTRVFGFVAVSAQSRYVVIYRNATDTGLWAMLAQISGDVVTYGNKVQLASVTIDHAIAGELNTSCVNVVYTKDSDKIPYAKAVIVSGATITASNEVDLTIGNSTQSWTAVEGLMSTCRGTTTNTAVVFACRYRYLDPDYYQDFVTVPVSISGSTLSVGTKQVIEALATPAVTIYGYAVSSCVYNVTENKVILFAPDCDDVNITLYGRTVTNTASVVTLNTNYLMGYSAERVHASYAVSANKILMAHRSSSLNTTYLQVVGISSNVLTTNATVFIGSTGVHCTLITEITGGIAVLRTDGYARRWSISGSTLSDFSDIFGTDLAYTVGGLTLYPAWVSIGNTCFVGHLISAGQGGIGALKFPTTTLSTRFIGYSLAGAADTAPVEVATLGDIIGGLSGLTPNTTYYLNSVGDITTLSSGNPLLGRAINATSMLLTGGA